MKNSIVNHAMQTASIISNSGLFWGSELWSTTLRPGIVLRAIPTVETMTNIIEM